MSAPKRIPALDGLRGLAIALVLAAHLTWIKSADPAASRLLELVAGGRAGVDLFFVLSGYLITGLLYDTRHAEGYFHSFYLRRFLRIFPLYYAFLVIYFIALPIAYGKADPEGVRFLLGKAGWYFAYLTNLLPLGQRAPAGVANSLGHLWSLAVEEQFYLVWPVVVWMVSRRRLIVVCGLLALGALVLRLALLTRGVSPAVVYTLTFTRMDTLALGACVALIERGAGLCALRRPATLAVAVLFPLSLLLNMASSAPWRSIPDETLGFSLHALLFAALLVLARTEARVASRLDCWPLRMLGRYSYALYILHGPILVGVEALELTPRSLGAQLAFYPIMMVVFVALALASWRYVEAPFLRLKHRVPRPRSAAALFRDPGVPA